ncbi:MAG: hypothetical protein E5W57_04110 [Mesorhizobium sp.]|nr:MAG: hypothetical protein E5W57_04110 [Mesorhizobium sp.]
MKDRQMPGSFDDVIRLVMIDVNKALAEGTSIESAVRTALFPLLVGRAAESIALLSRGKLAPGDAVRVDENGYLVKSRDGSIAPNDTLPPETVCHADYVEVPRSWVRALSDDARKSVMTKVF